MFEATENSQNQNITVHPYKIQFHPIHAQFYIGITRDSVKWVDGMRERKRSQTTEPSMKRIK